MNLTTDTSLSISIRETVAHLAEIMKQQAAFTAFLQAYADLQADDEAQGLLKEVQRLRGQLQFNWSEEKQAHFNQILEEFEALPAVKAYQRAELVMRELFCAVDAVISESAGVDFAVNARRSGCCG